MPLYASPLNAAWVGSGTYHGAHRRISPSWGAGTAQWVSTAGIEVGNAGAPVLHWTQFATPIGVPPESPGASWITHDTDFQRRQFVANASWVGALPYAGLQGYVRGSWSAEVVIAPGGFLSEAFSAHLVYGTQFIAPSGLDALATEGEHFALYPWQYPQPQWVLDASWVGKAPYTAPAGVVEGKWALPSEAINLSMVGWDSAAFGAAHVEGMRKYLQPSGHNASFVPTPSIINTAGGVKPSGFATQLFGTAEAWNFRQYAHPTGLVAWAFGSHFLTGGVKYVSPNGMTGAMGVPTVADPQADQQIKPVAVAPPAASTGHAVSPRILYAFSFAAGTIGAHGVGRPPSPLGFDALRMGTLVIEYKTKTAGPEGIFTYESGYPTVRDRAQKLFVQSALAGGVFGDVAIRNNTRRLIPPGLDASTVSPYSQAQHRNKVIAPIGYIAGNYSDNVSVENSARSLPTQGFDSLRMGRASETGVGYPDRAVKPFGIGAPAQRFGAPTVHRWPELLPAGWLSQAFGTQTIQLKRRIVLIQGFMTTQFGIQVVGLTWRKVSVMDGMPNPSMDKPQVSHGVRSIIAAGAIFQASTPAPWVSRRVRTLAPEGVFVEQGRAHNVAGSRFIGAIGFEATRWGARIIPERQFVYPAGMFGAAGLPVVTLMRRLLGAWSFVSDEILGGRWGTASLWNRTQFVTMYYFRESELNPPEMRGWTKIENRNRVVLHHSTAPGSLPAPQVQNKARAVIPAGIQSQDPPQWYKAGQVAARVRPLYLDGIEWPGAGRWAVVHNDARVIGPTGFNAQGFGQGIVESNRRSIGKSGTGFEATLWGRPFIADAIRDITFKTFDQIAPPRIPLPEVKLHTRYLEPPGLDASGIGHVNLTIHFNRITTRWTHRNFFGEPVLRNLTPELGTRGRNSEEFGDSFVRLQWRPVSVVGDEVLRFGATTIADTRRRIYPAACRGGVVSDKLVVKDMSNPVLHPRHVQPVPFPTVQEMAGYVPSPNVNGRVLYQDNTLFQASPFGVPTVHANSIRVEPGYFDLLVGEPAVDLRIREIGVKPWPDDMVPVPGKARVSPHTIWCTHDTPQQAVRNNGGGRWHNVNTGYELLQVGSPRVDLWIRRVTHQGNPDAYGNNFLRIGSHGIFNARQYVQPVGSSFLRFGFHAIPGGQRFLEHFDGSGTMAFGAARIGPPPYTGPQYARPAGLNAVSFGGTHIEHLRRTVIAVGVSSLQMGVSRGSTPFMWQGLRVGPPIPFIVGDLDAALFGETWVSHRVRDVSAAGFDAFLCTYTPEQFKLRMRVARRQDAPPVKTVGLVGIDTEPNGVPAVRHAVHYIRPDGNADQYRKGAF